MLETNNNYYAGVPVRLDARMWEFHAAKQNGKDWGYAYSSHAGRYGDEIFKVLWNNGEVTQERGHKLVVNKELLKQQKKIAREQSLEKIRRSKKRGICR